MTALVCDACGAWTEEALLPHAPPGSIFVEAPRHVRATGCAFRITGDGDHRHHWPDPSCWPCVAGVRLYPATIKCGAWRPANEGDHYIEWLKRGGTW